MSQTLITALKIEVTILSRHIALIRYSLPIKNQFTIMNKPYKLADLAKKLRLS